MTKEKEVESLSWGQTITNQAGQRIRELRQAKKLTVAELSKLTEEAGYEVPRNSLTNLELGRKTTVTIQDLMILAKCLDTTFIDLVSPSEKQASEMFHTLIEEIEEDWAMLASALVALDKSLTNLLDWKTSPTLPKRVAVHYEKLVDDYIPNNRHSVWEAILEANQIIARNKNERPMHDAQDRYKQAIERFGVAPIAIPQELEAIFSPCENENCQTAGDNA